MLSKRKILLAIGATLFLISLISLQGWESIGFISSAKAGDAAAPAFSDTIFSAMDAIFGFLITFVHFLLYILLAFAGGLLDPNIMDLKTGTGMANVLNEIWQISRNITNIILAFLLVIGGIWTVIFAEQSVLTKHAGKFVVAVILVNFSWFFPRVMLDLSNILTVTIYSIPSVVKSAPCQTTNEEGELGEPCKIITEFKFFAKDPAAYDSCPIIGNVVCIKTQNLEAKANSPHAILSGIVYNHAHLRYLARVVKPFGGPMESASVMGRLPQLLTFTLLSALVVFFSVALLFPVLAMVVVFMVRIPIIWLTVAFMPLTFIGVVAGEYMSILNPKKIFDVFAKAAFLPVIVAIPFSVGFLMLNVAMSEPNQNLSVDLNLPTGVPLIAGVKDPWQLLWVGMAIAVVWWGAFKALTWDESFAKLVSPIQNAGASFGRFLFKLPLLLPLPLPAPEGSKSPNILQALRVMREPDRTLISPSGELQTSWKNIWGMSGPNLPPDLSRQAQTLATQLQENSRHLNTLTAAMQRVNGATGEDQQRAATTDLKNAVREALREGGVTWNGTSQDLRVLFNDVWRNRLTPDRQRVVPQLNEANLRD